MSVIDTLGQDYCHCIIYSLFYFRKNYTAALKIINLFAKLIKSHKSKSSTALTGSFYIDGAFNRKKLLKIPFKS